MNDGNEAEDDDHLKQEDNMHKQELIKKKKENESYKNCRLEDGDKKKSKLSGITPEFVFTPPGKKLHEEYPIVRPQSKYPKCEEVKIHFSPSDSNFLKKEFTKSFNPYQLPGTQIYLPPKAPQYGHSAPTATITSNQYQGEQEEENKQSLSSILQTNQAVKIEPSPLDNAVYEGSITSTGLYINKYQDTSTPHQAAHGVAEHKERQAYDEATRIVQRPTVIRNARSHMNKEHIFLEMESQMLKMHGNLLKQTGNSFSL